ncbi:MAG: ATP synthase epsilon chain [Pirellulaceae bacterium]|nr:MAG: ATP synthase epsilon chain [Pirellulaceae bacterium]
MSQLQCVVVTPERTEIDQVAEAITVPLFDGQMGILRGHSPLVGRLGFGVLKIRKSDSTTSYFIEGGLVQVQSDVVSVLTDRVTPTQAISRADAEQAMADARQLPAESPEQRAAKEKAIARARAMLRVASQ